MASIDRTTTGIAGLNRLTRGGFPDGATISIIGSYGTGKTVTGIHFLNNGVTSLSVWGVRDNESWINHFKDYDRKYTDKPLIFDKNGRKKKAYREIKESIKDFS